MRNIEVSEWKIDQWGHKYRELGKGCIEYMPTIIIDGVEIYQDELEDFHRRRAEQKAAERARAMEELKNRPEPKSCPFSNDCNNTCKREKCKIFLKGKCSIATIADSNGVELEAEPVSGAKCPFSIYANCKGCALYNKGCAIVRLAASTMKGE